MGAGEELLDRIITYLVDPAIRVVFTLGLLLFIWGLVQYLWEIKDGKADGDGKQHMLWGLVGMLIMVSVYGIIALIVNTFQLGSSSTDASRIENVQVGNPFGD
jgi:predicted membrane channel-forming protein YqfA (hemolysin III family)